MRREVVRELTEAGMSLRTIADTLDVSHMAVKRDLAAGVTSVTPAPAIDPLTGEVGSGVGGGALLAAGVGDRLGLISRIAIEVAAHRPLAHPGGRRDLTLRQALGAHPGDEFGAEPERFPVEARSLRTVLSVPAIDPQTGEVGPDYPEPAPTP